MAFEPIITKYVREPNSFTLDFYTQHGGYESLKKAVGSHTPDQIVEMVKASGLRGRGGAGFPTGMKWQFVDKKSTRPRYIACNADESEPGTFKDHVIMERNPHLLIEGCAIACYAIGAKVAYIYIRGEFFHMQHVLETAIAEARAKGFLGTNIFGSGFDCEVYVHRGAGAYEAGEETALLESLEGKRAQPRNKPPFPAVVGLYGCPTAVNNVETLANVPLIVQHGPEWFAAIGPEKNGGPKLYSISGHVKRPGVYEASMDVTLKELIFGEQYCQGMRDGRTLKAVIPAVPRCRFCSPTSSMPRPASTASSKPVRCSARPVRSSSTTPPAWCGSPRTCCTSTSTSRAASARRAAKAPTGCSSCCTRSKPDRDRCVTSTC
jgi:NADH-quinone oxidoreductase subunit F